MDTTRVFMRANRKALCWGWGNSGQLGRDSNGNVGDSGGVNALAGLATIEVGGSSAIVEDIHGGWYHTCAMVNGSGLWCWGGNEYGQLRIGSATSVGDTNGSMMSLSGIVLLGGRVSCTIVRSGGDW